MNGGGAGGDIRLRTRRGEQVVDEAGLTSLIRRGLASPSDVVCSQAHTRGLWVPLVRTEIYRSVFPPEIAATTEADTAPPIVAPTQPRTSVSRRSPGHSVWIVIAASALYVVAYFLPWAGVTATLDVGFGAYPVTASSSGIEAAKSYPLLFAGMALAVFAAATAFRHMRGPVTQASWAAVAATCGFMLVYTSFFVLRENASKDSALAQAGSQLGAMGIEVSIEVSWGIGLYLALLSVAAIAVSSLMARSEV